jgi:hypothetical protein
MANAALRVYEYNEWIYDATGESRLMDQTIIDGNTAATQRLRTVIGRLDDEQLGRELDGGWTAAAMLAHLAFWDRRIVELIDRWSREEITPASIDLDIINDALLPQWRLIPPRSAAEDALSAVELADRAIAGVSPELYAQIQSVMNRPPFDRARHRNMHLDQIEQALSQ